MYIDYANAVASPHGRWGGASRLRLPQGLEIPTTIGVSQKGGLLRNGLPHAEILGSFQNSCRYRGESKGILPHP